MLPAAGVSRASVKSLKLSYCDNLRGLQRLLAYVVLKSLSLTSCSNLESLPGGLLGLPRLSDVRLDRLQNFRVWPPCQGLETIRANFCPKMTEVAIGACPKLSTVDITNCFKLTEGSFGRCPQLASISFSGCSA